jgi:hypothetical protein
MAAAAPIEHIIQIRITAVWSKLPHARIDHYYVKEDAVPPFAVITSWVDGSGGKGGAAAASNVDLHLLDVEVELRRRLAAVTTVFPFSRIVFRKPHTTSGVAAAAAAICGNIWPDTLDSKKLVDNPLQPVQPQCLAAADVQLVEFVALLMPDL